MDAFKPITKEAAAEILSVSVRTIENWVSAGTLPVPASIGGRRYWHPQVFYGWLGQSLAIHAEPSGDCLEQVQSDSRKGESKARSNSRASPKRGGAGRAIERHEARQEVRLRRLEQTGLAD